jgi:predicted nuclease with TOPRIM domain
MQVDPLVPIIVAIIGTLQVILSLYAGKKQNKAVTRHEDARATREIGESYASLIEVLERANRRWEEKYDSICGEMEELQSKYDSLLEKCEKFMKSQEGE